MKKANKKGYWEKQVDEFCGIFGFKVNHQVLLQDGCRPAKDVYTLKFGRSTVAYKDKNKTWCSRELPLGAEVLPPDDYGCSGTTFDGAMEALIRTASGKELIVRSSGEDMKTPYGFTKVRLIRHIKLPEFGSVEELKLKLAVLGDSKA